VGDGAFDVLAWGAELIAFLRVASAVAIGYDVARTGDLAAVTVLAKIGNRWRMSALVTMQKRMFKLQRDLVETLMRAVPQATGGGDSTGIGMQVCEELTTSLGPARFAGMNFSSLKGEIGTKLVRVFEDGRIELPAAEAQEDIWFDFAAIESEALPSGRVRFFESQNPVNKNSHCDIAWSCGIALYSSDENRLPQGFYNARMLQKATA
jgi:phage FluMu gp28-like protein